MESRLLDILVCPLCKSRLRHDRRNKELICRADKLAFPIRDGIPIMLEAEARELQAGEPAPAEADVETAPAEPSPATPPRAGSDQDAGAKE